MYQKQHIVGYFAETSLHAGGGESWGAIDLAIQRDKVTQHPIIAGSSLKGAIRAYVTASGAETGHVNTIFGPDTDHASDHAGAVAFTDARILLFPVRSLKGVYAWVTCPMVLNHFKRSTGAAFSTPSVESGKVIADKDHVGMGQDVVIDRYKFTIQGSVDAELVTAVQSLIPDHSTHESLRNRVRTHLIIVNDEDFTDMVRFATDVQTRIRIGENGTVVEGALFFQENLPAESLLYGAIYAQKPTGGSYSSADEVLLELRSRLGGKTVQMGGDGSIGKGFVSIRFGGVR